MKTKLKWLSMVLCGLLLITAPVLAQGGEPPHCPVAEGVPVGPQKTPPTLWFQGALPTDQIIIKYRASAGLSSSDMAGQPERMVTLSRLVGLKLTYFRQMSGDAHVLKLPAKLPEADVFAIARQLMTLPEVEYAEPDSIKRIGLTPNDPLYTQQWHYFGPFGIRLPEAWDVTTGASSVVVAVIDTGILFTHPDLAARTVAGYDFISDVWTANDGDGRDADPGDPGDWVAANDCGPGEPAQGSSWHGSHVAGTIGAASNNGVGVAGINWAAWILPVRVLGRCGGYTSDIVDGMVWAAGLSVPGVPPNANPARVLNLSLWGAGSCSFAEQNAIMFVLNAGATVVIIAGNANADASGYSPGNCNGVITVAATDSNGDRASFSNYGSIVEISGPGDGVLSTGNAGPTTPGAHTYTWKSGTSMAAPHVAGVASLLLSLRPGLTPDQVLQVLQYGATPWQAGSSCNASICGTGIVNAENTVRDIYVDGNYADTELGLPLQPFNTIGEAYGFAWKGARLKIKAGSYPETLTLSKKLDLVADGGTVTIGQ